MTPGDIAPVRIGVAGLGRSGMFHIERLGLRDDFRIVALYDDCPVARERSNVVAASAPDDWKEFLANDEIEVVLLATPPALHAELGIQALAAGKHVLVETPMCLNLFEADALIAASRRSGRSISVAHTRRWDDDYRTALQVLAGGELGRLVAIKFIDWHYNPHALQLSRRETAPGLATRSDDGLPPFHWRHHPLTGGGALWEFGIHYFDQLLQLAGRPAQSVHARTFPSPADEPADDGFLAVVGFPGNLSAHVEVQRAAAAPLSTGWTIAGDRGSYSGFTQYAPAPDGEVVDVPITPVVGEADEFYGQVALHVRTGGPNPVPPEQARAVIALIEAVRESARTGQVVVVYG